VLSTFVVGDVPYSRLFLIVASAFSSSSSRLQSVSPTARHEDNEHKDGSSAVERRQMGYWDSESTHRDPSCASWTALHNTCTPCSAQHTACRAHRRSDSSHT
jgi:hypothetical protein